MNRILPCFIAVLFCATAYADEPLWTPEQRLAKRGVAGVRANTPPSGAAPGAACGAAARPLGALVAGYPAGAGPSLSSSQGGCQFPSIPRAHAGGGIARCLLVQERRRPREEVQQPFVGVPDGAQENPEGPYIKIFMMS